MARASTTLDPFNALAESKRREVLGVLAVGGGELPVNAVVGSLGWPQPQVSKHLAVLREVGLVSVRRNGRERLYRVNGEGIKAVHDWTKLFEKYWDNQLDRIKQRAEAKAKGRDHLKGDHP
ncbi:MAG TPA: metalloregulator ArsR/SmtB family transcription factor [Phycisphaerales bacterium]|nr:metalloregulator ArsR/SmtB family transcription factor [Phycisphaerales bacterium]